VGTLLQLLVLLSLIWIAFFAATLDRGTDASAEGNGSSSPSRHILRTTRAVLIFLVPLLAVATLLWFVIRNRNLINPNTGRSGADPFVIALAQVNNCAVVTEEKARPTRPKIPDVCAGLGLRCINMLDLMRQERWSYR
jgi:hypothetical protein